MAENCEARLKLIGCFSSCSPLSTSTSTLSSNFTFLLVVFEEPSLESRPGDLMPKGSLNILSGDAGFFPLYFAELVEIPLSFGVLKSLKDFSSSIIALMSLMSSAATDWLNPTPEAREFSNYLKPAAAPGIELSS